MNNENTTEFLPENSFSGLTTEEVENRILNGQTNATQKKYSKSYLSIFASNLFTFFNLLGLIVTIALAVIGAPLSRFFFVVIYIANIGIGVIQEIRAKLAIDKLSLITSKKVKVVRNCKEDEILSTEIVLDDVILLGIGSQIPTDSKILEGTVEVNESLLTGESIPVKKSVGDELFAGSFIISGTCTVKAVKVGKSNYVEQLSEKAKKYKKPHSELMSSLRLIIKAVGIAIVPIAIAFIIKSMVFTDATAFEAIDGAAAVIIGMIPSGMFLLTSVALAVGVIKLARHNTLVQDLYSLEMLARVDTICFDKTGTITDGNMTVCAVDELDGNKYDTKKIVSSMLYHLKDDNQTAQALKKYFGDEKHYDAKQTLPFNSARKLCAVTLGCGATFAFGAPEFVLDDIEYSKLKSQIDDYAKRGLRVLVVARAEGEIINDILPNNFLPLAVISIADNVREDAISTIKWFKENDVAIKVISGDNPVTVAEVSRRVGIENADKYVSLEGKTDEEVFALANDYTVFGRVTPEQKAILVKALKNAGHVTAMTGDGVNDILALKEADCAVTVASGSDAARNVSHLVLADNNFNSMPKVVYEGRRVINNVQSSASLFLMKTIFTTLLAIISLCLPYMQTYPFKLSHMLLLEIFVIGLPSFFLSLQANDARVQGRFIKHVFAKSIPSGLLMLISVLIVEIFNKTIYFGAQYTPEIQATVGALALTFAGVVSLFYICLPLNKYRSVLFFTTLFLILGVTAFAIANGLENALELYKMTPLSDYWAGLTLLASIIVVDIPLAYGLKKLFTSIHLPTKHNKKEVV